MSAVPAKLQKEGTVEVLAAARHYGAMRFSMMAAFFILMGLLVNAYINWQESSQRIAILLIGTAASVWFAWFEFLLSYNLTKLWTLVKNRGDPIYSETYPQRNPCLIWLARVTLPLPYLVAGAAWGSLLSAAWLPAWWAVGATVVVWVLCIVGWYRAESSAP